MNKEELKEILQGLNQSRGTIKYLKTEINCILSEMERIRTSDLSFLDYNSVKISNETKELILCEYEKRIEELNEKINQKLSIQSYIKDLIYSLPHEEMEVLVLKYIRGYSWDFIPDKIYCSRAKCFNLHKKGIEHVLKMIDEENIDQIRAGC